MRAATPAARAALALLALALLAACATRPIAPTRVPAAPPTAAATEAPAASPTAAATETPAASPTEAPTSAASARPPTVVPTRLAGAELPAPVLFVDSRQQIARASAGPQGAAVQELTNEAGSVLDFDVSPADGSLAYVLFTGGGSFTLVRAAADGSARRELAAGVLRQATFDPTGARVLFAVDADGARAGDAELTEGIWAVPADGGAPEQLAANTPPAQPEGGDVTPGVRYAPLAFSPDGSQLLIVTSPNFGPDLPAGDIGSVGLGVMPAVGGEVRELVPPGGNPRLCVSPVWGPAGDSVYCPAPFALGDETPALYRIDLATGEATDLIPRAAGEGRTVSALAVLPGASGATVLLSYSEGDQPAGAAFERYADDPAARTVLSQLGAAPEPGGGVLWAPDGSGAVYAAGGERPALVWQPLGGEPRVLSEGAAGRARWQKKS